MKYVFLPVIWLALLLVNVAGLVIGLPALAVAPSYGARIFRLQNRSAAAVLGFSGDHGISHECGKRLECRFCRTVCKALGFMLDDPKHCENEAKT